MKRTLGREEDRATGGTLSKWRQGVIEKFREEAAADTFIL